MMQELKNEQKIEICRKDGRLKKGMSYVLLRRYSKEVSILLEKGISTKGIFTILKSNQSFPKEVNFLCFRLWVKKLKKYIFLNTKIMA